MKIDMESQTDSDDFGSDLESSAGSVNSQLGEPLTTVARQNHVHISVTPRRCIRKRKPQRQLNVTDLPEGDGEDGASREKKDHERHGNPGRATWNTCRGEVLTRPTITF